MSSVKCIIVDDEPSSREVLESYIEKTSCLELLASCKDAFEASAIVNEESVQLIFLDINMPKMSGMSFYKSLYRPPLVIFTTAYPQYAVEGFEVDALDYLLKPFSYERFLKAVNKVLELTKTKDIAEKYVLLKADKKVHRILLEEICYLQAIGDYVKVYYADKSILVHSTLQNMIDELGKERFFRTHRSYAIALNKIEEIEGNIVRMQGKEIPIGKVYRLDFLERIERGK